MEISELCKISHKIAVEKGFYWRKREVPELLMLIVTELAEACESDRIGDFNNFNEEIADTFIRLGDMCGYFNIDIENEIKKKMAINEKRPQKHGKRY